MTRHMFAGALTPGGFTDFFSHIMPTKAAQRRYFLKGSSGSGKSTIIKKVAARIGAGNNIDFFHCSNDSKSVDGIAVPGLGFSIIDATLPHSHDPELPGAVDEIVDLARFLDKEKVAKHLTEIKRLATLKKEFYGKAQNVLNVAGAAYATTGDTLPIATMAKLRNIAQEHVAQMAGPPLVNQYATNRQLFLSAITPDGIVNFADTTLGGYKVYGLANQSIAQYFLKELQMYANLGGISTESYYNPLNPKEILHIILPQKGVAYGTTAGRFAYTGKVLENVNTPSWLGPEQKPALTSLIKSSSALMKTARNHHNKMEELYVAAMDFTGVEALVESLLPMVYEW